MPGSFNPLKNREALRTDGSFTHDYVLKVNACVIMHIWNLINFLQCLDTHFGIFFVLILVLLDI